MTLRPRSSVSFSGIFGISVGSCISGASCHVFWFPSNGVAAPLALSPEQHRFQGKPSVRVLAESEEQACVQARVLFGESFPRVVDFNALKARTGFGPNIIIAGMVTTQDQIQTILEVADGLIKNRGINMVVCLGSPFPPKPVNVHGWAMGTEEISWSGFTAMDRHTYVTLYCTKDGMTGPLLADRIKAEVAKLCAASSLKGQTAILPHPLLDGPSLDADSPDGKRQKKMLAARAKLETACSCEAPRYMDAMQKSQKVLSVIPKASASSLIFAGCERTGSGVLCLKQALGYGKSSFNLALLQPRTQQLLLAGTPPAFLVSLMLTVSNGLL